MTRSSTSHRAVKKPTSRATARGHSPQRRFGTRPPVGFRFDVTIRHMSFPSRPRRSVAALGLTVLLAACGTTTAPTPVPEASGGASPTPPPSSTGATPPSASAPPQDPEALYAEIETQVQAIRGLQEKSPVDPKVIGED